MYHSISRPDFDYDPLCTTPERFAAQILYLKRRNLRGVSLRDLCLAMNNGGAFFRPAVSVRYRSGGWR